MSDELKPCPKCKSTDLTYEIWPDNSFVPLRVMCKTCQYSPDWWEDTREDAARYWNTRPLEDELRAEAASGERWADEYHKQAQALQAQVDKLKEVVEMVVAYGEIWKAKGFILPSEFEFVLFDAALHALHALEGGE